MCESQWKICATGGSICSVFLKRMAVSIGLGCFFYVSIQLWASFHAGLGVLDAEE